MLRNGTPTRRQRLDGALRYAGQGAVLTGLAALERHGFTHAPATDQVHVLVPDQRRPNTCGYVLIERTTRIPTVMQRGDFPLAEVNRAVLDAARRNTRRATIETLLAEAVQRRFTTPARLSAELEAGSDRGSGRPRAAIRMVSGGARSTAEADGMRLIVSAKPPEPTWNVALRTVGGLTLPTPDAWFDEVALAWEIDSLEWHLSPSDYAETLRRHAAMTGAGITVLHTLPTRLRDEPQAVIAELQHAYEQAARRPRPQVIAG